MITFSLQSGSNGNSIFVEAGGVRLLFDAGISGKCAAERMAERGRDIREVDAVLISHDHSDHASRAGVFNRKFGMPVFASPLTWRTILASQGRIAGLRCFSPGEPLEFGRVVVHTLPTPHDAVQPAAFVVEAEGRRLGILTDLGHPFPGLQNWIESLDAAYLESNYDPEMLETGPYPYPLKERIRGGSGHLSNEQAAELVARCGRRKPRWIALAHLSDENNLPDLALRTHRAAVGRSFPLHVAGRHAVSEALEV